MVCYSYDEELEGPARLFMEGLGLIRERTLGSKLPECCALTREMLSRGPQQG